MRSREYRIALAGNPNTGKSTLFNLLTGLRQHTGNWPGKTVRLAEGTLEHGDDTYTLIDLPGTYSLYSNSTDEEVARDYIIFEKPDVTVVVLDATAIERNMNLALQVLEMTDRVIVCVNLIDEARRKSITVDAKKLSARLGVPVLTMSARNREGIDEFLHVLEQMATGQLTTDPIQVTYSDEMEAKIAQLEPLVRKAVGEAYPARWIALRLLDGDEQLLTSLRQKLQEDYEEVTAYEQPVRVGS